MTTKTQKTLSASTIARRADVAKYLSKGGTPAIKAFLPWAEANLFGRKLNESELAVWQLNGLRSRYEADRKDGRLLEILADSPRRATAEAAAQGNVRFAGLLGLPDFAEAVTGVIYTDAERVVIAAISEYSKFQKANREGATPATKPVLTDAKVEAAKKAASAPVGGRKPIVKRTAAKVTA